MRAYRLLLRLLPRAFRDDYGRELETTFSSRLARARTAFARWVLWSGELGGLAATAVRVHGELLRQDLAWSLRALRRAPGFALTVVAVSAIGIGATTATFSVTDHVLVRPLPFAQPDRLVKLWQADPQRGNSRLEVSPAKLRDWRERSRSFADLASYWSTSVTLVGAGEPERLEAAKVSASLADVLRIQPALGRFFAEEDDRDGAEPTVVLAYDFWRTRFAGDRDLLGRKILLDGAPSTVIGVLPPGIRFPSRETRIWMTHRFGPGWYEDRTNTFLQVIARLRPGLAIEAARAELAGIATQLAVANPGPSDRQGIAVIHLRDELSRESRLLLVALLAAAVCLLLLACTNLASLLLARSLSRGQELAVRAALGGGRARLVRQMLTESLLLAAIGGLAGVALAYGATPAVARLVPTTLPIAEAPAVDLRLLFVATLLAVATGVGFGLAPALRAPAEASAAELREGARAGTGKGKQRWRRVLVATEVMLSITLLVASGLLLRALGRLQAIDPGFREAGVVTLRTWLPRPEYDAAEKRHRFYSDVLERVRALPGVASAGYTTFLPMTMRGGIWSVKLAGQAEEEDEGLSTSLRFVTPGLFASLGVPLRSGRDVSDGDTLETEKVAVVSESFARRFFPNQDPLGRRFEIAFFPRTIVGVVGDVAVRGLGKESEPQVYLPHRQIPDGWMPLYDPKDLAVRARGELAPIAAALRRIVAQVDPNLPVSDVRTLAAIVEADTAPRTAQLRVLGAFAATALLLAGIGLHGLLSFAVSSRRQEIGLRMAIGATAGSIVSLVLRQGLLPAAAGAAAGLALAAAAGRAIAALLAGVSPFDGATYLACAGVTAGMALLGALVPALRAARLDPVAALRSE